MSILTFKIVRVCVLPDRFILFSKRTEILSIYIIVPIFITILSAATVFGVARMDDDGYDRRKNLQKNYMHNSLIMLVGKTIETCNVEINSWFAVPQAKKFLKKQLKQW